jgi:hypothetical protein
LLESILNETVAAGSNTKDSLTTNHLTYVQVFFSGIDREKFISRYYPQYLPHYQNLLPGAYKADLWRLLVIYRYGGIYMDIGMRLMPGIIIDRDIVHHGTDELVLSIDQGDLSAIANNFLIAYPRHPVIAYMIRWVVDNIANKRYGCNNLDIAGPKAIGRALHSYLMVKGASTMSSEIETGTLQPFVTTLVDNFAMGNWNVILKPRPKTNDYNNDNNKRRKQRRRMQQHHHVRSNGAQTGRTPPGNEKSKKIRLIQKTTPKQDSDEDISPDVNEDVIVDPDDHMHVRFYHLNNENQIIDQDEKKLTQNKFQGYQEILYHRSQPDQQAVKKHITPARRNGVAYGIFYYFRKVYSTDLDPNLLTKGMSVDEDPSFFNMNPSNQGVYEGSLVQAGRNFWLVINNTRWSFPNFGVFNAMGMEQCRGCVSKSKEALDLPTGPMFSSNPQEYWAQLNQVMPPTIANELALKGSVSVPSKQLPSLEDYQNRLIVLYSKYGGTTIDSVDMLSILESSNSSKLDLILQNL